LTADDRVASASRRGTSGPAPCPTDSRVSFLPTSS